MGKIKEILHKIKMKRNTKKNKIDTLIRDIEIRDDRINDLTEQLIDSLLKIIELEEKSGKNVRRCRRNTNKNAN